MNALLRIVVTGFVLSLPAIGSAQPAAGPPADDRPVARIEAEGPLSYVGSLAFSPDGRTLYAAGWDKRVHVWTRDAGGAFAYRRGLAFRIPLGPGQHGHVNALAVSPDGAWLAVGGYGMARNVSGFRETGKIWPKAAMTDEMRLDLGQIYVFHTTTRECRVLRGHAGPVVALAFAPAERGKSPLLVSAGREESTGEPAGSVRLWNVEAGREAARLDRAPVPDAGPPVRWPWRPLPDPGGWKPDLSAWHVGGEPNQVRVAIAWGDNDDPVRPRQGWFRIWDAASGRVSTASTSPYLLTASAVPGRERQVVTGAFGQIGLWTTAPGGRPEFVQLDGRTHSSTIVRLDGARLPRAAALVGPAAAPPQRAAFIVEERQAGGAAYELVVVDLSRGGRETLPLWRGAVRGPALAASPDGRWLAAAGAEANDVRIIDVERLGGGANAIVETLRASETAAPLRSVAFARNAQNELGLNLRETTDADAAPARDGRILFDVHRGTFAEDAAAWRPDAPDAAGFALRAARGPDGRALVEVVRNGAVRRIELEPGAQPTAMAVCPPGEHFAVPLVAVASEFRGEPILGLYNGETGDELRRLTGHVERVRSVAFSADGALLASAGEDWTVCVWWLRDVGETLGRLGLAKGLAVEARDGRLIVREDPDGPLQPGDEIAGLVERGPDGAESPVRLASTWDLYQSLSRRAPGSGVTLQIVRNGQRGRVEVAVGQGIDERKPLFSLFVTPDRRSWIGWQPVGRFDAGSRAAEAYLGWHFNTGRDAEPARFASVEQYREDNFTPGLLRSLIAGEPVVRVGDAAVRGDEAVEPLPEPKIALYVVPQEGDPLEREAYDGYLLARTTDLTAIIEVEDVPARLVGGLEWSFDGGEFQSAAAAQQTDRLAWEIDLSQAQWRPRRVQQLAVRLVLRGTSASESTVRESVLYLPPPPVIALDGPEPLVASRENVVSTREPRLTLAARIAAGHAGEAFVAELRRGEQVVGRWTSEDGREIRVEHDVMLAAGSNPLELLARNHAGEREAAERSRASWVVDYLPEPDPPAFLWKQVIAESGGAPYAPAAADGAKRFIVDVPEVRIQGRIEAGAALRAAEYIVNPEADAAARPLSRFEPARARTFEIDEVLRLRPGRQLVRFRATTASGREATDDIEFEYRPKLPSVLAATIVVPGERPERRNVTFGDRLELVHRADAKLELLADLALPPDVHEFRAEVLVDDTPLPAGAVRIEDEHRAVRAELALASDAAEMPDIRRVHVRLTNDWSPEPHVTPPLAITYRHPPRIVSVEEVRAEALRIPRLGFEIASPDSRPVESVTAAVNGRELPDDQLGRPVRRDRGRWTVEVADVPLREGENEIVLVARNHDGWSLPQRVRVEGRVPEGLAMRPEIELVSPAVDNPVSSSRLTVEFRVRSHRPLRMVDLVVETPVGQRQRHRCLERLGPADARGFLTFKDTIPLTAGENHLSVEAVSDGLTVSEPVVLNVLSMPVELLVEKLVPAGRPAEALTPEYHPDGIRFSRPLPAGHATLHGRVQAGTVADAAGVRDGGNGGAQYQLVRVWINGFLRTAPVRDGAFELPVVLNQEQNHLQLELPYLAVDDANRHRVQQVHVACARPEEGQHLHLLIVGADPRTDADELRGRLEQAFHLGRGNRAFVYQPPPRVLCGDRATRQHIRAQLTMLRWRITRRPGGDRTNDVLMVYYEGRAVERNGEFVLLDQINWNDPGRDPASAVTSGYLTEFVNSAPGAHLVLLDVESDSRDLLAAPERWPPHLGMLGVTWHAGQTGSPSYGPRLIAAIDTAIPGDGRIAATADEIRLKSLEAALRSALASAPGGDSLSFEVRASDDLKNLLLARAAAGERQ